MADDLDAQLRRLRRAVNHSAWHEAQLRRTRGSHQFQPGESRCPAPSLEAATATSTTLRVAHCVVGVASHANRRDRFPIYDPRQYGAIARWLRELDAFHVVSDVFLHLDIAKFAPKTDATRRWATEQQQARSGRRTNLSRLAGVLAALRPVGVHWYDSVAQPFCGAAHYSGSSACGCSESYPRWWEQVSKHAGCLRQLRSFEQAHGGVPYDFVTKLRTDYNFTLDGASAAVVAAAMRSAGASVGAGGGAAHPPRRVVFVQAWMTSECYMHSDWFALAPRAAADVYLRVAEASCGWQLCMERRFLRRPPTWEPDDAGRPPESCLHNERLLIEWLLWHNVSVRVLPDQRTYHAHVCAALEQGDIDAHHPWHRRGFTGGVLRWPSAFGRDHLDDRTAVLQLNLQSREQRTAAADGSSLSWSELTRRRLSWLSGLGVRQVCTPGSFASPTQQEGTRLPLVYGGAGRDGPLRRLSAAAEAVETAESDAALPPTMRLSHSNLTSCALATCAGGAGLVSPPMFPRFAAVVPRRAGRTPHADVVRFGRFHDDHTWVEVAHGTSPWAEQGLWLYEAGGGCTGIYWDVGRSLRAFNRVDALTQLLKHRQPPNGRGATDDLTQQQQQQQQQQQRRGERRSKLRRRDEVDEEVARLVRRSIDAACRRRAERRKRRCEVRRWDDATLRAAVRASSDANLGEGGGTTTSTAPTQLLKQVGELNALDALNPPIGRWLKWLGFDSVQFAAQPLACGYDCAINFELWDVRHTTRASASSPVTASIAAGELRVRDTSAPGGLGMCRPVAMPSGCLACKGTPSVCACSGDRCSGGGGAACSREARATHTLRVWQPQDAWHTSLVNGSRPRRSR